MKHFTDKVPQRLRLALALALALASSPRALADSDICPLVATTVDVKIHDAEGLAVAINTLDLAAKKGNNGLEFISLKKVYKDLDAAYGISFGLPHVAVFAPDGNGRSNRYDGRLAFIKETTVTNTPLAESGALVDFPALPEVAKTQLEQVMARSAGRKTATCVNGACELLREAGFEIGDYLLPKSFLEALLRNELKWNGEPVEIRVVLTKPIEMQDFLDALGKAPRQMAIAMPAAAAKKLVVDTYQVMVKGLGGAANRVYAWLFLGGRQRPARFLPGQEPQSVKP